MFETIKAKIKSALSTAKRCTIATAKYLIAFPVRLVVGLFNLACGTVGLVVLAAVAIFVFIAMAIALVVGTVRGVFFTTDGGLGNMKSMLSKENLTVSL